MAEIRKWSAQVHHVRHPLVEHHLASLRNEVTSSAEFRRLIQRLSVLLAYEATQDMVLESIQVKTPLCETNAQVLAKRIGLIPILRAGLGMVDPILDLIPQAEVWHLGLYRDEATAKPVSYYDKLPPGRPVETALILDPMLATGGSLLSAYQKLKEWGVPTIKMLSIISAPEGIQFLEENAPDAKIYVCAIDECLNDDKFIVPGLGDAGDRTFNAVAE